MTVTMRMPQRARPSLCTRIIEVVGPGGSAGPFFLFNPASAANGSHVGSIKKDEGVMTRKERGPALNGGTGSEAPAGPRAAPLSRKRIVSRLWRTAERQVAEIETRMVGLADDPMTLERDAKTLAIIAKTVRDLVAIDAEAFDRTLRTRLKEAGTRHGEKNSSTVATSDANPNAEEYGPRDIEGFRAELARRLDELRCERAGDTAS